jgi:hypothetical protein
MFFYTTPYGRNLLQSLKLIIDPLVASFIPVANAFFVLGVVISFCKH